MTICLLLIITGTLLSALQAASCPIPVYRYALEFWEPDPYRITIYYQGALTDAEKSLYQSVMDQSAGGSDVTNVDVKLVNLETEPQALDRQTGISRPRPELPLMVVQFPFVTAKNTVVWDGPFTQQNVESLLNSPVRMETADKLARGIKVWILLESGNRRKDNEAMSTLERELNRLEQTLVLPDPELWWTEREGIAKPEIKFEVIRVSRDDPAESALVQMLQHSEDDLLEFEQETIVFPVYGRGIALWAIVGAGINSWNITDAAEFLIGPCSCQVKLLNPGIDLLFSKDWKASVDMISDAMLTPVTGFSEFEERGREVQRRLEEEEGLSPQADQGTRPVQTQPGEAAADPDRPVPADPFASGLAETRDAEMDDATAGETSPLASDARSGTHEQDSTYPVNLIILLGIMDIVILGGIILFKITGKETRRTS